MYGWWLLPLGFLYFGSARKANFEPYYDQFYAMLSGASGAIVVSILLSILFRKTIFKGIAGAWQSYGISLGVYLLGMILSFYFVRNSGGACPGGSPFLFLAPTLILNMVVYAIFVFRINIVKVKKIKTEPENSQDSLQSP
jgi:hypothetical protein